MILRNKLWKSVERRVWSSHIRAEGEDCNYTKHHNSFRSELLEPTRESSRVHKIVPNVMKPNVYCLTDWFLRWIKCPSQFKTIFSSVLKSTTNRCKYPRTKQRTSAHIHRSNVFQLTCCNLSALSQYMNQTYCHLTCLTVYRLGHWSLYMNFLKGAGIKRLCVKTSRYTDVCVESFRARRRLTSKLN